MRFLGMNKQSCSISVNSYFCHFVFQTFSSVSFHPIWIYVKAIFLFQSTYYLCWFYF